jgi:demethylmenaquinone methyltransferase/2-methoxy-6-polyprenyl-1,4-benzoquinol methylase
LLVGDARSLPFGDGTFNAAFASFTLELFSLDDIPVVLAEVRRVLKPRGRLGIVSMATVREGEKVSLLEKTYIWMHRHFPHIVDCQPIDATGMLVEAGFQISRETDLEIWTMPVRVVVGVKPA